MYTLLFSNAAQTVDQSVEACGAQSDGGTEILKQRGLFFSFLSILYFLRGSSHVILFLRLKNISPYIYIPK